MKEFNKWAGPGYNWGPDPLNRPGLDSTRRGWRAAMELSLRLLQDQYEGGLNAFDTISKELADD